MKCCEKSEQKTKKSKRKSKKTYEFVSDDDDCELEVIKSHKVIISQPVQAKKQIQDEIEELREEDFTLRTLDNSTELPLNNNVKDKVLASTHSNQHVDMISNFSTLERTNTNSPNRGSKNPFYTSTPLKPPTQNRPIVAEISQLAETTEETQSIKRINSVFLEGEDTDQEAGNDESLPQIHEGHYFNVFNIFKLGGARYEYRVARKQSQMSNHSQELHENSSERRRVKPNDSKFTMYSANAGLASHDTSTENENPLLPPQSLNISQWQQFSSEDDERLRNKRKNKKNKKSSKSYDESVDQFLAANQNDFLLSNSFSNMSGSNAHTPSASKSQRSYGLFIEEGQMGRYNPLPEAQSELWPPKDLVKMKTQRYKANSTTPSISNGHEDGLQRRSRSMDVYPKGLPRPPKSQESRRTRPLGDSEVQSHIDVCCHTRTQSADRKLPSKSSPLTDSQNEMKPLMANGASEKVTSPERSKENLRKRPPPVPLRTSKKSNASLENGILSSEPPTPPPPLLDDLPKKDFGHKRLHSLDEIFNFERNILYGRETTL